MSRFKTDYTDIEVLRTDTQQIVIPESMDLEAARDWLDRRIHDDSQLVEIDHKIHCFPMEGAAALAQALQDKYGWTSMTPKKSFWGDTPPGIVTLRTGPNATVGIPWGRLVIPGVKGYLETNMAVHKGSPILRVTGMVQRKNEPLFREILAAAEHKVATDSIYRGQALRMEFIDPDGATSVEDFQPQFMDLSTVDVGQLVFSDYVSQQIDSSIMALVEHTTVCREAGVPLKRGILLAGPYGTGKTLTAKVLAKKCEQNDWTFLLIPDVSQLDAAVEFARRFQPCAVFCEDIDQVMQGRRRDSNVNAILNTIDGIESKDTEIMVVLTTNHVERIEPAMLRPGRIDHVIEVSPPDADAALRLVRTYTGDLLVEDESMVAAGQALSGQIPAVIREVCERSKLAAISARGSATEIYGEDLIVAANGMRSQTKLLAAQEPDDRSDVEKAASILGRCLTADSHSEAPRPDSLSEGRD